MNVLWKFFCKQTLAFMDNSSMMRSYSAGSDVTKRQHHRRRARAMGRLKAQLCDADLWRAAAAEFIATFFFLFILCFTLMMPQQLYANSSAYKSTANSGPSVSLQISVGIALAYASLIQCFESISGGYMNPAMSLAMFVAGHIGFVKAILYVFAQMAGAFSAVALCFGMIPNKEIQLQAVSKLNDSISTFYGFGIEILQSVVLAITWLATYVTSRHHLGSSALPVGMAVLANSLWAGQLTGSSTNPARSIPPAALTYSWENLWIYAVGPLVGCIGGAFLYSKVFITSPRNTNGHLNGHNRNIEGESVKSDQEPAEHLSHVNQDSEIQTTNFTTPRSEVAAKSTSTRDLSNVYYHQNTPRVVAPSVTHPLQNATVPGHRTNHCVVAPKLYRQASAPPTRSMIQTLPYAASNGSNSTNVTLTRESSRIPSRASTACGSLTTKPLKSNSVFDPAGPVHSQSVSAFHSTPMDPLLNDSLM